MVSLCQFESHETSVLDLHPLMQTLSPCKWNGKLTFLPTEKAEENSNLGAFCFADVSGKYIRDQKLRERITVLPIYKPNLLTDVF